MKSALICYHKNVDSIYPPEWIRDFRYSILNQTHKDFDIFELNYGGGAFRIFENSNFISSVHPTFAHGLNMLLDLLFSCQHNYDCVFNTNVDDYYSLYRIERQLPWIAAGYDVVSSNMVLVRDGKLAEKSEFDGLAIHKELNNKHNIIAHPAVAYSKLFWRGNRYDPNEIPYEDMKLWQRSVYQYRFMILPENLLYHRIHNNSICQNQNNR